MYFLQCTTGAKSNYSNSASQEQIWTPWFALAIAPISLRCGIEVELIDARIDNAWRDKLKRITADEVLAVSVITGNTIKCAIEATEIVNKSGALIIWGGVHATLFPYETLSESFADFVVSGSAYRVFGYLCDCLCNNTKIRNINNRLIVINEDEYRSDMEADTPSDMIEYYLPLVQNWEPYVNKDIAINTRTVNFVSSEGCPMKCRFCSEPLTSRNRWLARKADSVVNSVITMVELSKANGVKFHDANFFANKKRAFEIISQAFVERSIRWAASIHPQDAINLTHDELGILSDSGLSRLLIGLESPNKEIIEMAAKRYDTTRISDLATRLKQYGIVGMFTYIAGWPNIDESHYQETVDNAYMIKNIWGEHQAKIHFLEPWPGTEMYEEARLAGYVAPCSLAEWANVDYYQEQFHRIYNDNLKELIKNANLELCPYVDA
jgi:radical SAM superfamily enzyme YgiQ (UPF0313 family)